MSCCSSESVANVVQLVILHALHQFSPSSSAGSDYRELTSSSRVYFDEGQTVATYTVTIYDNTVPEETKDFYVQLMPVASGSIRAYTKFLDMTAITIPESDSECCLNVYIVYRDHKHSECPNI